MLKEIRGWSKLMRKRMSHAPEMIVLYDELPMGTVTQAPFSTSYLFEILVLCPTRWRYAGSQELVSEQRQRMQGDWPWKTSVSKVRK